MLALPPPNSSGYGEIGASVCDTIHGESPLLRNQLDDAVRRGIGDGGDFGLSVADNGSVRVTAAPPIRLPR
jgi:hypothetical protein